MKLSVAQKAEKVRILTCGLDTASGSVACSERTNVFARALTPAKGNKGKQGMEDETDGVIGLCGADADTPCRYRGDMTITAPFVFNPFIPEE